MQYFIQLDKVANSQAILRSQDREAFKLLLEPLPGDSEAPFCTCLNEDFSATLLITLYSKHSEGIEYIIDHYRSPLINRLKENINDIDKFNKDFLLLIAAPTTKLIEILASVDDEIGMSFVSYYLMINFQKGWDYFQTAFIELFMSRKPTYIKSLYEVPPGSETSYFEHCLKYPDIVTCFLRSQTPEIIEVLIDECINLYYAYLNQGYSGKAKRIEIFNDVVRSRNTIVITIFKEYKKDGKPETVFNLFLLESINDDASIISMCETSLSSQRSIIADEMTKPVGPKKLYLYKNIQ